MKNIYETSPFGTFFPAEKEAVCRAKTRLSWRVYAPVVRPSQRVYVVGSCEKLGGWNVDKALPLTLTAYPYWSLALDMKGLGSEFEYKFIVKENGSVLWEEGENRRFYVCGE